MPEVRTLKHADEQTARPVRVPSETVRPTSVHPEPVRNIKVKQSSINIIGATSSFARPISISTAVVHYDGHPYTGEYIVTPKVISQRLDTTNKILSRDVKVLEIPYYETSNESGITALIGDTQNP